MCIDSKNKQVLSYSKYLFTINKYLLSIIIYYNTLQDFKQVSL